MKRIMTLAGILFLATSAGADLQTDMLTDRLDRLDKELTILQKKVYEQDADKLNTSAKKQRRIGFFGTVEKEEKTVSDAGLDDLYAQLDEQNKVIEALTRKIEELSYAQDSLKEQLKKTNDDVEMRFQLAAQKNSKSEVAPKAPSDKKASKPAKPDKEAYDAAYHYMIQKKYDKAAQAFVTFLKDYPQSALAGNANYWLGETYYVRGQYEVAAGIFSDGLTKYDKSSKAPDNLLKLGLTMKKLNKKEEACGFLTLLPEQFPKAGDAVKKAKSEAEKLACPK